MKVLNFQRMSTEDGPGLRTTVFVKGCPLKCRWCHNPESIPFKSHIEWVSVRCIGCLECVKTCPNKALTAREEGIHIDREQCKACGKCVDECPTGALEVMGKNMTVKDVFDEVIKDRAYFGADGGVTLSGGEIMLQADESSQLLKLLKESDTGTAIDTCGMCKKEDFDKVLPYTDVVLYDMKVYDSTKHKEFTGVDNKQILENFLYVSEYCKSHNKTLWVRTPIIPGATDSDDNIKNIARFIKGKFDRWELCAFNNLCRDKYERLYQNWFYQKTELMCKNRMNELVNVAINEGLQNVYATGATRIE